MGGSKTHRDTYSNLFNFDFTVQGTPNMFKLVQPLTLVLTPTTPDMFKLVQPLTLVLTPTTPDMFKLVQCDARTVGKQEVHYYSGPNTSVVVQ